ncbi:hypothetical protein [Bradyrhizobium sp. Tv2a-2]|uniref:hypothetical protein n=1 Tax=Bradyrhizobium sp. Tv2a-2 TaxID=113395 RepID=UPI0012EBBD55|nr:hypothetical protein [Bradyrhizobium sp. Tv2a-2]
MKLVPLDRRELIWAWARWAADVDPRPFSKICDHNGWARATAYARLERLWDHLLFNFGNAFIPFRPAADRWARLASQPIVINEARVADCAPVKHAAFISEKSTDTLKTPDAIAAFVAHLEDVNEHRRRALVKRLGRDMAA